MRPTAMRYPGRDVRSQTGGARTWRFFRFPFYFAPPFFTFLLNHLEQNRPYFFFTRATYLRNVCFHSRANKNGTILRNSYIVYLMGGGVLNAFFNHLMLQFLKTLVRLTPRCRLISVRYIEMEEPYALTGTILNVIDSFE